MTPQAFSPQSLTCTVIESAMRLFELYKLQLSEATQLTARNYLQNEHSVRALFATLRASTSKRNCWQWAEEQNLSSLSYGDGSCCRDGGCFLHPLSWCPETWRVLADAEPCGKRTCPKPSCPHLAPLTDTGNANAAVLDLFKHTRSAELCRIIKAVFFNTWNKSCATL